MSVDLERLRRRARRRYELGRWTTVPALVWPLLPLLALALWLGCHRGAAATAGAAALLLSTGAALYGRAARRAVLPGLAAGSLPTLLPLLQVDGCGGCLAACWHGACWGGLLLGVCVGLARPPRAGLLGVGGAIATCVGAMGCWVGGITGIVALIVGLTVSASSLTLVARVAWRER